MHAHEYLQEYSHLRLSALKCIDESYIFLHCEYFLRVNFNQLIRIECVNCIE